jgi:hypothetical protein
MTDITERLKEAHALYDKVGIHGANGAGLMVDALARIEELEAARDFGIIEGDIVAHLQVVALTARVEELTAALDALRGRYRLYSGWPEMSWAGDTDVALLKMADQALGDTT